MQFVRHKSKNALFFCQRMRHVFLFGILFPVFFNISCNHSDEIKINAYLLDIQGEVSQLDTSLSQNKTQKKKKYRVLSKVQKLPQKTTIKTAKLATAHLQFNHFLSLRLDENTVFSYQVRKLPWNTRWGYQLDLRIKQGGVFIQFNGQEDAQQILILANEYFWCQESVSFHFSFIDDSAQSLKNNTLHNYTNVSVIDGGLHYISPITGQVDMYISAGQKFMVKNNAAQEIQYLSALEKKYWQDRNNQPILGPKAMNKKLFFLDQSSTYAFWYWIATALFIAIVIGFAIFLLYRRHTKLNRFVFHGTLVYWEFASTFIEKKYIHWNKRRGRRKIYLGSHGFCHIKIKEWQGKRRGVIQAHLDQNGEYYTIRHVQGQIAYLNRKDPNRLSHGDEFIIHSYHFQFKNEKD